MAKAEQTLGTERIEVRENKNLGIRVEGKYRRASWGSSWVLTHWRIRPGPESDPTLGRWSPWRKVHGNQRKPIGGFALVIDDPKT